MHMLQIYYLTYILSQLKIKTMDKEIDLYFIRHGQSLKNEAAHNYQHQRGLDFNWQLFCTDPVFLKTVTHNPKLIDCHLSEKGKKDCLKAKENLKDFYPDVIFVSPLQRALQTCHAIFGQKEIPVIVEPLISQTFKHSSEICRSIEAKKKQFPKYDFSKVEAEGEFWFIKNDSLENQKKYFDFLKQIESELYEEKAKSITEFMEKNQMRESHQNTRLRANKMKEVLKEAKAKYSKICVVSHYYTIKYMNAKVFDENNEPITDISTHNGGAFETTVEQLLKYR